MAKEYTHRSEYFYGNRISLYGLQNNRVDYGTLAKAFDAVLCNDITKLFYGDINGEYNEAELVNGAPDYSDELDELRDELDELENKRHEMAYNDEEDAPEYEETLECIAEINDKIEELEELENEPPEVYQWYIISDPGAAILQELTDEIVYYIPVLDCYVWGVTHFGTAWDYVLTDIKIEL